MCVKEHRDNSLSIRVFGLVDRSETAFVEGRYSH